MMFLAFIGGIAFGVIMTGFYFEARGIGQVMEQDIERQNTKEREKSKVQFIDPITPEQKFKNAQKIDDILQ